MPALDALAGEPRRYNAMLRELEPIAPEVLTQTLRRLQEDGLIEQTQVGRLARQAGKPTGRRPTGW